MRCRRITSAVLCRGPGFLGVGAGGESSSWAGPGEGSSPRPMSVSAVFALTQVRLEESARALPVVGSWAHCSAGPDPAPPFQHAGLGQTYARRREARVRNSNRNEEHGSGGAGGGVDPASTEQLAALSPQRSLEGRGEATPRAPGGLSRSGPVPGSRQSAAARSAQPR